MEKDFTKIKPHKTRNDNHILPGLISIIKQVSAPVRQILEILEAKEGSYLIVEGAGGSLAGTRYTSTRAVLNFRSGEGIKVNSAFIDNIIEYCERIESLGKGKYKYQLHPRAMEFIRKMEQTI